MLPIVAPMTPPMHINIKMKTGIEGISPLITVLITLETWEHKMIKREFIIACLGAIEKK